MNPTQLSSVKPQLLHDIKPPQPKVAPASEMPLRPQLVHDLPVKTPSNNNQQWSATTAPTTHVAATTQPSAMDKILNEVNNTLHAETNHQDTSSAQAQVLPPKPIAETLVVLLFGLALCLVVIFFINRSV